MHGNDAKRVLIVSDLDPDPDLNTAFLQKVDIHLLAVPHKYGAVDVARRERPDLIVEAVHGRDAGAVQLCRRFKTDDRTRAIPLILVTAEEMIEDAQTAGPDELLAKPLVPQEFFEAVRRYVPLPTRRHLRYRMNLRFTCHVEGRALQAFSRDISMNGAFLKTDRNFMQGTHLRVEFALPGQQDEIGCGARVRNVVPPGSARGHTSGVGIEFEGIRDQDLQRLEDYIGRQGRHHRFR